jgi:sodium pump decarboxylase gamma subunit
VDPLLEGLLLSGAGLAVTFLALGLLIVIIVLLNRVFGGRTAPAEPATEPAAVSPVEAAEADDLAEVAAAVAAAVTVLRAAEQPAGALGSALESGPGRWWGALSADGRQLS